MVTSSEKMLLLHKIRNLVDKEAFRGITDIDPQEFFDLALDHRLFNIMYDNSKEILMVMKDDDARKYKIKKTVHMLAVEHHMNAIIKITERLETVGLPYIVLKGLPQSVALFGNVYTRDVGDIDLLVKEEDVDQVCSELCKIGCKQMYEDEATNVINSSINGWEKSLQYQSIIVEVKWASSAIRENIGLLWDETSYVNIKQKKIRTLNKIAMFVHTISNTHENNEGRSTFKGCFLRDYYECIVLLRRMDLANDVAKIVELMQGTCTLHKMYEVLNSLDDLFKLNDDEIKLKEMCLVDCCSYNLELDGWAGKDKNSNGALQFNKYKPDAVSRVFDRDYSTYLFNCGMKNAIYNKRTTYDAEYVFLQRSSFYKIVYNHFDDVNITIGWTNCIEFNLVFAKSHYSKKCLQKYTVEIQWYEKDIASSVLFSSINIDFDEVINSQMFSCSVLANGYYRTETYRSDCCRMNENYKTRKTITVKYSEDNNIYNILISLDISVLPICVDSPSVVFDLAFKEKRENEYISYGIKTIKVVLDNVTLRKMLRSGLSVCNKAHLISAVF